jgi:serine protease
MLALVRRAAVFAGLMALIGSWPSTARAVATTATVRTGNLLVLLEQSRIRATAASSAVDAAVARVGGQLGGAVPQIGLLTVRPPHGMSLGALAQLLRALPGVASVEVEHRFVPRFVPNDPALTAVDPSSDVAWQWYLVREGFYRAWGIARGNGALVGVIDTGIDARHPDLSAKIAAAVDQQQPWDSTGPADTDRVGHGTDVASLACADTDNGIGMAGAGYNCKLVIEKSDFSDSSVAAAIVDATDRHVDALNMSFGPASPSTAGPAPESEVRALRYAATHKVVLVAAAADSPGAEQGDPSNVLQPSGTGAKLSEGIGLDVTAADYNGGRASFAGYGSEISLAAYGAFNAGSALCAGQPVGIFGAYPSNPTELEQGPNPAACRVDLDGDSRYATIAGTSMATPQVAATAAMMRALNPFASLQDILRTLKLTARRPKGRGWSGNLGWGILDAGAALDAIRRLDRLPPVSFVRAPRVTHERVFLVRWFGHDQRWPGLISSGIAYYDVYVGMNGGRLRLIARTRWQTLRFRGSADQRYVFGIVAVDRAGNRQRHPARATTFVS